VARVPRGPTVDRAAPTLVGSPLRALTPAGTFYLWVDVRCCGLPSRDIAFRLLDEWEVAVAPGTAFGDRGEGFARISLAASELALMEGISRLIRFAASL
jgi:aspartate/methionine/tyrosine aminotransferase